MSSSVTVGVVIHAPIEKIWQYWIDPQHIQKWYHASDDWHAPSASNDLRVGGKFTIRMEAKDGSSGFDFEGTYMTVEEYRKITYIILDGRMVEITFTQQEDGSYKVTEVFEAEDINSIEMQKAGWQAILDNFRKYAIEA